MRILSEPFPETRTLCLRVNLNVQLIREFFAHIETMVIFIILRETRWTYVTDLQVRESGDELIGKINARCGERELKRKRSKAY